jgi:hypothetical protein
LLSAILPKLGEEPREMKVAGSCSTQFSRSFDFSICTSSRAMPGRLREMRVDWASIEPKGSIAAAGEYAVAADPVVDK